MTKSKKLYEGLPKEMGTTLRSEAIAKYGKDTIKHSEKSLINMGKRDFTELIKEQKRVNNELFKLSQENPESEIVQDLITEHYLIIRKFWGTSKSSDLQAEAYAGLGDLYLNDERYTMNENQPQQVFALFLQKAMKYFTHTKLAAK